MSIELSGKIEGNIRCHTEETLKKVFEKAYTVVKLSNGELYEGELDQLKHEVPKRPTVLFMHGSSGINPAIRTFAKHLAENGFAFLAPDSMQVQDRLTYSSPVARNVYEEVHAMRYAELRHTVAKLNSISFFDNHYVIAGTSEGAVSVARFINESSEKESARMIFSWSCENNYHVIEHNTHIPKDCAVLNIMSAEDPYFSQKNSYLDNPEALGHAANTLKDHPNVTIVLLPKAPHTLFNLPQATTIIDAFLKQVL